MVKPQAQPEQTITILQLTDLHFMSTSEDTLRGLDTALTFRKTLDFALANHPESELVLLTGDLAEQPVVASYQRIYDILTEYPLSFSCLPGNHDDFPAMLKVLDQDTINCNKRLLLGNWQIIMLNSQIPGSAKGYLTPEELNFMTQCLAEQPQRYALIAVHHHCIATESKWLDTMVIRNSDELFELLRNYPRARAVTVGHIHQRQEQKKNHLFVYGTPSTCFQFKPYRTDFAIDDLMPGYRWLKLYTDGRIESDVRYLTAS